tara:strand:- start:98 stop:514 length:417 start_codon:yes stop_codon:yes gene_type:complete
MMQSNSDTAHRLALRYAQIADDRDFESMRDIIRPDFTQVGPDWRCDSADAFIAQLEFLRENFDATLHMLGNQLGSWNADHYAGETYCTATHLYKRDGVGRKTEMGIRYQDNIVMEGGRYYYQSRDVRVIWVSDHALVT